MQVKNTCQVMNQFNQKQALFNQETVRKKKREYHQPNMLVQFDDEHQLSVQKDIDKPREKSGRHKNQSYAELLKQQITMNHIQDENQLAKSRKIDQQNANFHRQKYPYGCEGVKVREDVVEKYKASNYEAQKNMLQKFQRQAEEFRKNKVKKYQNSSNRTNHNPTQYEVRTIRNTMNREKQKRDLQNISFLSQINQQQKQKQELQLIRQRQREQEERKKRRDWERLQRREKRKQFYLQREKQNLVKVGNMLREIDFKLKQNSSKLTDSLRELKSQLRSPLKMYASQQQLLSKIKNMRQSNKNSYKIPVILYNNKFHDARTYYEEGGQIPNRMNRSQFQQNSGQMKDLLKILRKNQQRLKILTQQSEEQRQIY